MSIHRYSNGGYVEADDLAVCESGDDPFYHGFFGVVELRGEGYETILLRNGCSVLMVESKYCRQVTGSDRIRGD